MTKEQQIKALAELDGWTGVYFGSSQVIGYSPKSGLLWDVPDYLTSYDAIIPLIQKQLNRHTCHSWMDALGLIAIKDWADVDGSPGFEGDGSYFEQWVLWKATPAQLCEALLRATGKWIEL